MKVFAATALIATSYAIRLGQNTDTTESFGADTYGGDAYGGDAYGTTAYGFDGYGADTYGDID